MRTSVKHPTTRKLAAWGMKHRGDDAALVAGSFTGVWFAVYMFGKWQAPWDCLAPFIIDIIDVFAGLANKHPAIIIHRPLLVTAFAVAVSVAVYAEHAWAAMQSEERGREMDEKRERNIQRLRDANLAAGTFLRGRMQHATQLASERVKPNSSDQNVLPAPKTFASAKQVVADHKKVQRTRIPSTATDATNQLRKWLSAEGCQFTNAVTVTQVRVRADKTLMDVKLASKPEQRLSWSNLAGEKDSISKGMEQPSSHIRIFEGGNASEAVIEIVKPPPPLGDIPHPHPKKLSVKQGIPIGATHKGAWNLDVLNFNTFFAGATRQGKSKALESLLTSLNGAVDVNVCLLDPKRVDFVAFKEQVWRYENQLDGIYQALTDMLAVMNERYDWMAANGVAKWEYIVSPQHPWIIIALDEAHNTDVKFQEKVLAPLARQCLGAGITLLLFSQRPTKTDMLPPVLVNCLQRVVFRCANANEWGYATNNLGVDQTVLTRPGDCLVAHGGVEHEIGRTYRMAVLPPPMGVPGTSPVLPPPALVKGGAENREYAEYDAPQEPPKLGMSAGRARMLELVHENPGLSIARYAELAVINKTNAHKHLQWLRDNGHVTRDWHPVESESLGIGGEPESTER